MYYLSRGLAEQGKAGLGRVLAVAFAIFCIFGSLGGGNAFQANQAFAQVKAVTGGEDGLLGGGASGVIFGLIVAAFVGVVIIGGIRRIASVTDKLVPFMAVFYLVACIFVLAPTSRLSRRPSPSSSKAPSRRRASPAASSASSSPACNVPRSPTRPGSAPLPSPIPP